MNSEGVFKFLALGIKRIAIGLLLLFAVLVLCFLLMHLAQEMWPTPLRKIQVGWTLK